MSPRLPPMLLRRLDGHGGAVLFGAAAPGYTTMVFALVDPTAAPGEPPAAAALVRDTGAGVVLVDAVVADPTGLERPALARLLADVADSLRAAGFRRLAAPPLPPPSWAAALSDAGFRPATAGGRHVALDL